MAAKRRLVDHLLRGENHQISNGGRSPDACVHPVWREKVIRWYFAIVSALDREQQIPDSPFNRSTVHVATALLDSYLLALPSEVSLRYKHDRAAYQLLATTCLLIGMRLTQHDQRRKSKASSENKNTSSADHPRGQLKRAKTHRDHMDQADHQDLEVGAEGIDAPSAVRPNTGSTTVVVLPTAATILQMSAAPKTISESKVLAMVREVTGSRAFPRSHVITALDYIRALTSSTQAEKTDVTLNPEVAEQACRLADISLMDSNLIGCRPSVVASAVITMALFRSHHGSQEMAPLRQDVCAAIVGEDLDFQVAVRKAEARLLAATRQATNAHAPGQMHMHPPIIHHVTAHLIPQDE